MSVEPAATVRWGDPGPVATIPAWLITAPASGTAIQVYALLSLHVGTPPPTFAEMGATLGVSAKAIQKALGELVAVGAVTKTGPRAYTLLLAQGAAQPKPAPLPEVITANIKLPPKIVKVDGRNLPFDALCIVCDIDERSPRINAVTAALHGRRGGTGITQLFWVECERQAHERGTDGLAALARLNNDSETYSRLLAQQIESKAALIRRKQPWRDALTPQLIRDLWLDIAHAPDPAVVRGMTPEEIRAL